MQSIYPIFKFESVNLTGEYVLYTAQNVEVTTKLLLFQNLIPCWMFFRILSGNTKEFKALYLRPTNTVSPQFYKYNYSYL